MAATSRELSGYFLPDDKFQAACTALADPACTTTALRLYHNEPHHTAMVLGGLSAGNASLEELDVFELDPAAAAPLAAYLAAAPRLASLVLHHVHGEAAARDLAPGLAASRTLSHLHFTLLDAHSVGHVAQALSQWQGPARLAHLRLERCTLQREQAAALAAALGRQAAALCRLELAACVLGEGAAAAMLGAPGFAELRLEHLDLSRCAVGAAGARELGRLLASNLSGSLHTLQLVGCSIGDEGAAGLQPGLASSSALTCLDLSENAISEAGAKTLATGLQASSSLQVLRLSHNAAGAAGLAALLGARSPSLPSCPPLRELHLDHNTVRGASLGPSLPPVIPSLQLLDLANNSLLDAGTVALAAALVGVPCLRHLDLRSNGVGDAGAAALLPLLTARPDLEGLLLEDNRLHNAGAKLLYEAAEAHAALWNFRLDGNKLTDPALRATISELSHARAARHSQEAVHGRRYSSDSGNAPPLAEKGPPRRHQQQPQPQPLPRHRLGQEACGSGADGQGGSARSQPAAPWTASSGGGAASMADGSGGNSGLDVDMVDADAAAQQHREYSGTSGTCSSSRSSGGGSSSRSSCDVGDTRLPPSPAAMCYITAMMGVGGAGTVVGKRSSCGGSAGQVPPAAEGARVSSCASMRRMRYKPLTAAQQLAFNDF